MLAGCHWLSLQKSGRNWLQWDRWQVLKCERPCERWQTHAATAELLELWIFLGRESCWEKRFKDCLLSNFHFCFRSARVASFSFVSELLAVTISRHYLFLYAEKSATC